MSQLTGAKSLSYGPNVAASLAARQAGFDDALLLGRDGAVLEGPTYSVLWIAGDVLETPEIGLGILNSITRSAVLEVAAAAGYEIVEGVFPLARLLAADEVGALSTTKELAPVAAVGSRTWPESPRIEALAAALDRLIDAETGRG